MKHHGMPVGTFTGDECISGRSPIQGVELCAVVELMYSFEWLYAVTGDKKWAELLEKVALNALPAAVPGKIGIPHEQLRRARLRTRAELRLLHGKLRSGMAQIRSVRVHARRRRIHLGGTRSV